MFNCIIADQNPQNGVYITSKYNSKIIIELFKNGKSIRRRDVYIMRDVFPTDMLEGNEIYMKLEALEILQKNGIIFNVLSKHNKTQRNLNSPTVLLDSKTLRNQIQKCFKEFEC